MDPLKDLLFLLGRDTIFNILPNYCDICDIVSLDKAVVNYEERINYLDVMRCFPPCDFSFYRPLYHKMRINKWLLKYNMLSDFKRLSNNHLLLQMKYFDISINEYSEETNQYRQLLMSEIDGCLRVYFEGYEKHYFHILQWFPLVKQLEVSSNLKEVYSLLHLPHLEELRLFGCKAIHEATLVSFKDCQQWQRMEIFANLSRNISTSTIQYYSQQLKAVEIRYFVEPFYSKFGMVNNNWEDLFIEGDNNMGFIPLLQHTPHLLSLTLRRCVTKLNIFFSIIANSNPQLEKLKFHFCPFSLIQEQQQEEEELEIQPLRSSLESLTTLEFRDIRFKDLLGLLSICESFSLMNRLQTLKIHNWKGDSERIDYHSIIIRIFPQLQEYEEIFPLQAFSQTDIEQIITKLNPILNVHLYKGEGTAIDSHNVFSVFEKNSIVS
jgi:hypothetical protein